MKKLIAYHIAMFFAAFSGIAQQASRNTGNLQVHSGGAVTIFGNFTNTSGAALVNNGSLYVRSTLTNDQASMSAGAGTLYLNGTSAQTVDGSQVFNTNNLVTDNSSGITLNNNLSVSGAHTYTSGLIATSSTPNYLVYQSGSSYSGSNDSRHVTGWVKKIGSTDFTFPVGNTSYLRAAAISNLSVSAEINCRYYTPTANTNNLTSPVVMVKANEYWQIDKVSGGSAQIGLNWDHSKVAMDNVQLSNIVVAHYTGGSWTDAGGSASGNVTTTGSITSGSVSSFSPFTLGYKSFPIPLKLLTFTADRRSGVSFLKWTTENEENVSHFDVQRSYDGRLYSSIGNVPARNTGSTQQYSLEDHDPLRGIAYYRIKSVDNDGRFTYSRIAIVSENDNISSLFAVLNPVQTALTIINKTGREGLFEYRFFNAAGQLVMQGAVNMGVNGGTLLPLPPKTAAGLYVLELKNGTTIFRTKVIVEK